MAVGLSLHLYSIHRQSCASRGPSLSTKQVTFLLWLSAYMVVQVIIIIRLQAAFRHRQVSLHFITSNLTIKSRWTRLSLTVGQLTPTMADPSWIIKDSSRLSSRAATTLRTTTQSILTIRSLTTLVIMSITLKPDQVLVAVLFLDHLTLSATMSHTPVSKFHLDNNRNFIQITRLNTSSSSSISMVTQPLAGIKIIN